jgi:hypothetical protein
MYVKLITQAVECEEAYKLALENYTELSKKINNIFGRKSNLCQVDTDQEKSVEEMMTICAKGLKKKQGSMGRHRYKSFIEMAKKKKKISIHRPIQTKQYLEVLVSQFYTFIYLYFFIRI